MRKLSGIIFILIILSSFSIYAESTNNDKINLENSLNNKFLHFKKAGQVCLGTGLPISISGLGLLISGLAVAGYGYEQWYYTRYITDQKVLTSNEANNVLTPYLDIAIPLISAGAVLTSIGIILDIFSIILYAQAWDYKNVLQRSRLRSATLMPFCTVGSDIKCGIRLQI